jgi:hypothetical protein
VRNDSDRPVTLTAVSVQGNVSDFVVDPRCNGVRLERGFRCQIGVRFAPKTPGQKAATVRIGVVGSGVRLSSRLGGVGR